MISVVNKGEETGSNLFVIAIACVMLPAFFICSWKQTYFNGKSRINTPDSVDSYIPTPSYQQNREYAWNPQHYHYPPGFGRWDSLYPGCNHENLSEQTEVRVNS